MKTKILFLTIIIGVSGVSYAQSFDWTTNTFNLTVQDGNGVINSNFIKSAPYVQAGVWNGVADNLPADGWVLLSKYLGTTTQPLNTNLVLQNNAPYFVIYNKYRSILRIFINTNTLENFSGGYMTLLLDDANISSRHNSLLTHLGDRSYGLDQKDLSTLNTSTATLRVIPGNWAYADFLIGYDPDINVTNFEKVSLLFNFVAEDVTSLNFTLDGTSYSSPNYSEIREFLTGDNEGPINLSKTSVSPFETISGLVSNISASAESGEKLAGTLNDFAGKVDSSVVSGTAAYNAVFAFKDLLRDFASGAPFGNVVIGALNYLSSGGGTGGTSTKYYSAHRFKGQGTLKGESLLPGAEIGIPGGTNNSVLPIGVIAPTEYNTKIGVFNLLNTPIVEYKKYFKLPSEFNSPNYSWPYPTVICGGCTDGQNMYSYRISNDFNYVVNPNSGLTVTSIKFALVGNPFSHRGGGLNGSGYGSYNNAVNFLRDDLLTNASSNHPDYFVESAFGNELYVRTDYYDLDFTKTAVLTFPKSYITTNPDDIYVKLFVEFERNDDPTAEKIVQVYTYHANMIKVADDGEPWLIEIPSVLDQNRLFSEQYSLDGNYEINSSEIIFKGATVNLTNNSILEVTGSGAILDLRNATVNLGKDAKIEVRNGGKLITDGATIKRLNASDQHDGIRLYTSGNQIVNTTIEGGYYGIYMGTNSDNNTIENSVFDGNSYGIYAYNSDGTTITGSTIKNVGAGIWALYSSLDVDPNVSSGTQTRTLIENSTGSGIVASLGSNVSVRNTTLTNIAKNEFKLYTSARMDLGYHSSGSTDHGKNILSDAPNSTSDPIFYRYVYSIALTGSGETATQWEVPARKNYWYDGTAPNWVDFYGSVDYSNHLTSKPAGASKIIAFNNVESAETGQNKLKQGFSSTQVDNSIRFKQSIQELKQEITGLNYDPRIAKLIRTYSGMIDASDKELMKEEIRELRQLKRKWLARYQYVNDMVITDTLNTDISEPDMSELNTSIPDTGLVNRISAVQTVGEVMLALEMRQAIDNENYGRVFKLIKEYDGRVRGKDLKFELISYLIKASIETQRNELALRLIDRLEAMEPEDALLEDWIPLDFTSLRLDITDEGKAKGVSYEDDDQLAKAFESDIYLDLGEEVNGEAVSEFKLYSAYPNPFNPSTIISFDLPQQGKVRVDVFDISGRLVSVLANQTYQSGNHRLTFEASGLASGVYLVRANIAGNIQTQRITLIK